MNTTTKIVLALVALLYNFNKYVYSQSDVVYADGGDRKVVNRYPVASFTLENVISPYGIAVWILLGCLAKIAFHNAGGLTKRVPESCLLISIGVIIGGLLYATKFASQVEYVLKSEVFFIYLLPPIILEAGYFMPNRPFFENLATILIYAIVNTLFNTILIGITLWAFNYTGLYGETKFELLHCFVFSSLISAVDPVAVIATFVEIGVNDMLYIIVFGESLLNDGVAVVLYRIFATFSEQGSENVEVVDVFLGISSFFVVALGGTIIGIIFGIIGSFTTKFTEHARVLEPLIVLTYSYLAYLTADMCSTSGILSITFCGMFLKQYVEVNIGKKSSTTIEYTLKMMANIMETIIFLFIGLSVESDLHSWNTCFVIVTLVTCFVYRTMGVFLFAKICNIWRFKQLTLKDKLIMSYGGIRGAVAFALALILDEKIIPTKKEFITATTAVVFFTIFFQGVTIAPIVKYLHVALKKVDEPNEMSKLSEHMVEYIMSAFEGINGNLGDNKLRTRVRNFDKHYLKPFLCRDKPNDRKLISILYKNMENNETHHQKPKDGNNKENENQEHRVDENDYETIQTEDNVRLDTSTSNYDDVVISKGGSLKPLIVTQSEPDEEYENLASYTHYRL